MYPSLSPYKALLLISFHLPPPAPALGPSPVLIASPGLGRSQVAFGGGPQAPSQSSSSLAGCPQELKPELNSLHCTPIPKEW